MFRFRLQQVLDVRAAVERHSARELGAARAVADAARRERDHLAGLLVATMAELHGEAGVARRVGELQHQAATVTRLHARVTHAAEELSAAESQLQSSVAAYRAAVTKRHVLDRLRDRHGEVWKTAVARGELSGMDAVALTRYSARRAEDES